MTIRIAFIGTAGIPNRYGGFESFLEHCAPVIAKRGIETTVTCDARLYANGADNIFLGVQREFIRIPANGAASIAHDLIAFFRVLSASSHIIVLGVSGGIWFPLFRLICSATGKRLAVNIDGVEWRRTKFSRSKRALLKIFDWLAQRFSHHVIYDSQGLRPFLLPSSLGKATCIAYPGDHVRRLENTVRRPRTALTICRIEPENNLELLIDGAMLSTLKNYTIVGNWNHSDYARSLRHRYAHESRLQLLDPIYDPIKLAELRESCEYYLHGHSVGGTNPSLVEMLFYDCAILCFDVEFNRRTAEQCAGYFKSGKDLQQALDGHAPHTGDRQQLRSCYTAPAIADAYLQAVMK